MRHGERPWLLDLFCGAGGAGEGYRRAGFHVVGIDIVKQPHNPHEFYQDDALRVLDVLIAGREWEGYRLHDFQVIHASDPCQFATAYKRRKGVAENAVNLIAMTRERLQRCGVPYIIENIELARAWLRAPIRLCGSSFGLDVRRHRLFESNCLLLTLPCDHDWQTPRFPHATNRTNLRRTVEVGSYRCARLSAPAVGIDWMTLAELSLAIPPAYTTFIGKQLMSALESAA